MKQTALEWLMDKFLSAGYSTPNAWKKQAKEMEKEQIKDAYKQGTCHHGDGYTATDYYEETFVNTEK